MRTVFYNWICERLRGNSCKSEMCNSAEETWKQKWGKEFKKEQKNRVLRHILGKTNFIKSQKNSIILADNLIQS